jgi:hypothetical protein
VLDVDLEMVLEVLSHRREVMDDADAEGLELARIPDSRELEELRGVDRTPAEDHLAGAYDLSAFELDADRA